MLWCVSWALAQISCYNIITQQSAKLSFNYVVILNNVYRFKSLFEDWWILSVLLHSTWWCIITSTPSTRCQSLLWCCFQHKNFHDCAWDNAAYNVAKFVYHTYCCYHVMAASSAQICSWSPLVDLLTRETQDFVPRMLWPPNSPDLNPESVVSNAGESPQKADQGRQRTALTAWNELDQWRSDMRISELVLQQKPYISYRIISQYLLWRLSSEAYGHTNTYKQCRSIQ